MPDIKCPKCNEPLQRDTTFKMSRKAMKEIAKTLYDMKNGDTATVAFKNWTILFVCDDKTKDDLLALSK